MSTPYEHGFEIRKLTNDELRSLLRKRLSEASYHANRTPSLADQLERIKEEIARRAALKAVGWSWSP